MSEQNPNVALRRVSAEGWRFEQDPKRPVAVTLIPGHGYVVTWPDIRRGAVRSPALPSLDAAREYIVRYYLGAGDPPEAERPFRIELVVRLTLLEPDTGSDAQSPQGVGERIAEHIWHALEFYGIVGQPPDAPDFSNIRIEVGKVTEG